MAEENTKEARFKEEKLSCPYKKIRALTVFTGHVLQHIIGTENLGL
jgi:hypothetical protein